MDLLWNREKSYKQLASVNRDAIREHNERMLSALTLIGGILLILPVFGALFNDIKALLPAYLLAAAFFFAMYFIFKLSSMKKYVLCGLYICFSIFFIFAIYLSVVYTPNMRATILLGAFCLMPLGFIDRPARMNLFAAFWFIVHTILAFRLKLLQYALDDLINSLCFAVLGCFMGNLMIWVRLEGYEARRLLIIEKETDVLTGLFNRRKLFETLALLETAEAEKPSGILMIDIDNFKEYNDKYGHAAGDKCLNLLGEVFNKFTQSFRIHFYRYGGDEFVAIAYGYGKEELLSIAESLRIAQSTNINGYNISISIGVAYCGDEQVHNYERIIDRADKAAYCAKHAGKNIVCVESDI